VIRTCAVIAFFMARMTATLLDLGAPPAGLTMHSPAPPVPIRVPRADAPPTIISGLPQDAGTLRR
jgi:hypothetical protein